MDSIIHFTSENIFLIGSILVFTAIVVSKTGSKYGVYDKPVIAVDTHVFRVSHRLGLSDGKTPDAVGKELEKNIDKDKRAIAHHWLILQGRYICTARKPHCEECGLTKWCREFNIDDKI